MIYLCSKTSDLTRPHGFYRYNRTIDKYSSLIWTDRYNMCGDFELEVDSKEIRDIYLGDLILSDFSDRGMIVESIVGTLRDDEYLYKISGRSLESILDKRVNTVDLDYTDVNPGDLISEILRNNMLTPEKTTTIIYLTISQAYKNDPRIMTLKTDYNGSNENVYDMVKSISDFFDIGFKIKANMVKDHIEMIFEMYKGNNRTLDSKEGASKVVFNEYIGNLSNAVYRDESVNEINYIKSNMIIEKPNEFGIIDENAITKKLFKDKYEIQEPHLMVDKIESLNRNSLTISGKSGSMCYYQLTTANSDDEIILQCIVTCPDNIKPYLEIFFTNGTTFTSKLLNWGSPLSDIESFKNVKNSGYSNYRLTGRFIVPKNTDKVLIGFPSLIDNDIQTDTTFYEIRINHGKNLYPYVPYGGDFKRLYGLFKYDDFPVLDDDYLTAPWSGLSLNEKYVDIPFSKESNFDWIKAFVTKAKEVFKENSRHVEIEFEVDNNNHTYVYNKDYIIGDLVSVSFNGNNRRALVSEVCYTDDTGKQLWHPKFEIM